MARRLLYAELAILREAGASLDWDMQSQQVYQEHHSPPHLKRQQWFNTDFVIHLDNWDHNERPRATSVPIRPHTLGADFFVMITPNGIPTQLELLEGESIGKPSFHQDIRAIEKTIASLPGLPQVSPVDEAPYLRVARLKRGIAFWVASTTSLVKLLNDHPVCVDAGRKRIAYRSIDGEVLIDGLLYD